MKCEMDTVVVGQPGVRKSIATAGAQGRMGKQTGMAAGTTEGVEFLAGEMKVLPWPAVLGCRLAFEAAFKN